MRLHADLKNEFTSAARSIVAAILQLHYGTKYMPKHVYPMKQLQLSGSDALGSICPFCECAYEPAKPAGKTFFSHAHAFPNKRRLCAPLKYMRCGAMPY